MWQGIGWTHMSGACMSGVKQVYFWSNLYVSFALHSHKVSSQTLFALQWWSKWCEYRWGICGFDVSDLLNYLLEDVVLSADSHDNSTYNFSFNKGKLLSCCPHVVGTIFGIGNNCIWNRLICLIESLIYQECLVVLVALNTL